MLKQMLVHNLQLTYVTPNAGRLWASWRAGAGKEKKHENAIPQIPRLGGDMELRFSKIPKRNTGVCTSNCLFYISYPCMLACGRSASAGASVDVCACLMVDNSAHPRDLL
jgi:hypothetical protein